MRKIVFLIFSLLIVFPAIGRATDEDSQNRFFLGAEANFGEQMRFNGVIGGYVHNVSIEFRLRCPFQLKETAYYNLPLSDGTASQPHEMEILSNYGIEGLVGYGISFGKRLRLIPSGGIRYIPLSGTTPDGYLTPQQSHVLSGIGALKTELILLPRLSLVATPEIAVPLDKDLFVSSYETVCTTMKTWYEGVEINVGIRINF